MEEKEKQKWLFHPQRRREKKEKNHHEIKQELTFSVLKRLSLAFITDVMTTKIALMKKQVMRSDTWAETLKLKYVLELFCFRKVLQKKKSVRLELD